MVRCRMARSRLEALGEFPFRRLARLLAELPPADGVEPLDLGIGEPQHPVPPMVAETIARNAHLWNKYPPPTGTPSFRATVTGWLTRRYGLPDDALDPDRHVLPVAGTKEAIYLLGQLAVDRSGKDRPAILMPSPFYAVYYGAAVMNGAEPVLLPSGPESGFLPDLDRIAPADLDRAVAFYLCSPANPQGAVADAGYLARALELARRHDFLLVLDECYAELWDRAPPTGGLDVAVNRTGALDHLLVLHSLSKRSNAAGLRSGFVAGDPAWIAAFTKLRAYSAAVQPMPLMAAAEALWQDEAHVEANRELYRRKFDLAEQKLAGRFGFHRPAGGFFLWLDVGDGVAATRALWRQGALKVLPGAYLDGPEPISAPFVRLALVHDLATVGRALDRFVDILEPIAPDHAAPAGAH